MELTLNKDDMYVEAGRKILLFHFQSMKSFEPSASKGSDPEGVHQMRVATRKFRSTYMVFRNSLPPNYHTVILRPMKRTAKVLGDVRDMDVQLGKIRSFIDFYPQYAHDIGPLTKYLNSRRSRARRSLKQWFASKAYASFHESTQKLLSEPLTGSTAVSRFAARPLSNAVPSIIYRRIADVDEIGYDAGNLNIEDLHELRIRGKKLRYTLESFASLLSPKIKPMLRALKEMLDVLGEMNDATITLEIVESLQLGEKESESAWRVFRTTLHDEIVNSEAAFPAAYTKVFNKRTKSALAHSVGNL